MLTVLYYECTKINRQMKQYAISKSSASGVKAFPYEPGFKTGLSKEQLNVTQSKKLSDH